MNHEILDVSDLDFTKTNEQIEREELEQIYKIWADIFGQNNEMIYSISKKGKREKADFIGCAGRIRFYCVQHIGKDEKIMDNLLVLNKIFSYLGLNKIYLSQIGDKVHDIIKK